MTSLSVGTLFNLEVTILSLMVAGVILTRCHIIDAKSRKALTSLVIKFVLPCNIIESFLIDFNKDILFACGSVLVISIGIQIISALVGCFAYRRTECRKLAVLKYATMVSNAGFMGNPIAQGLFGNQGLLFASIYLIPQRILMWSYGISCFTDEASLKKVIKKLVKHPCIIAVVIGMLLMVMQIKLPSWVVSPIEASGKCTTALSMIVIGSILSEIEIKQIFSWKIMWYCLIRLVLLPCIVLVCGNIIGFNPLAVQVSTVLSGMPAATTTALLADQYKKGDERFAVNLVFCSTVLSVITIPLLCMLMWFY